MSSFSVWSLTLDHTFSPLSLVAYGLILFVHKKSILYTKSPFCTQKIFFVQKNNNFVHKKNHNCTRKTELLHKKSKLYTKKMILYTKKKTFLYFEKNYFIHKQMILYTQKFILYTKKWFCAQVGKIIRIPKNNSHFPCTKYRKKIFTFSLYAMSPKINFFLVRSVPK